MASKEDQTWNSGDNIDNWTQDSDSIIDRKKEGKCGGRCKKVLKGLFSHVGITGMVVAYSFIGGFIFQHLEETNEKQVCVQLMEKYQPMENKTILNIWEISKVYVNEYTITVGNEALKLQEDAIAQFEKILAEFRANVLELDYDGKNCTIMGETGGPGFRWSFPGALLFSVTVITTIGKLFIFRGKAVSLVGQSKLSILL